MVECQTVHVVSGSKNSFFICKYFVTIEWISFMQTFIAQLMRLPVLGIALATRVLDTLDHWHWQTTVSHPME